MSIDPAIALASAVVGFLVGMTGAGGGALMTPMLILLFGVAPSTAISSDLVAAVLMRPVGAAVHMTKGTVNYTLVGLLVVGSVPAALLGAYVLHLAGASAGAEHGVQILLGVVLLLGAAAMVVRAVLDRRAGRGRQGVIADIEVRPAPTIAIGVVGGMVVGMTSVGSGSLMIVLLLCLYPLLGTSQLVGTDLTQAVPLTLAAALGALAFGHVSFAITSSVVVGSVPAVLAGSLVSARAPDRVVRPAIVIVILATALRSLGVGAVALGWTLGAVVVGAAGLWAADPRAWRAAVRTREGAEAEGRVRGTGGHDGRVDGVSPPA